RHVFERAHGTFLFLDILHLRAFVFFVFCYIWEQLLSAFFVFFKKCHELTTLVFTAAETTSLWLPCLFSTKPIKLSAAQ
ncbi:hypothetical protein ACJX0J_034734, partial [Zea mays]